MINRVFEKVEIIDAGSEGKAIARIDDLVVFVPFVVPGDVIDIELVRKKKSYLEGRAIKFHHYSEKRQNPFCGHFGTCGGCRWQNMKYEEQLFYKEKQVRDAFQRIGKFETPHILPIIASPDSKYYRNKLEYTFSNHRWLIAGERRSDEERLNAKEMNALGFHIPLMFDKVLDINHCYLQPSPSDEIRLEVKKYAGEHDLSFYDVRKWQGFLRNLIIRTSPEGEVMLIFVFSSDESENISALLDHVLSKFPGITSIFYVINGKKNDIISDLDFIHYKGDRYIREKMFAYDKLREIEFHVGPASFFQTNSAQARILYRKTADLAEFAGKETVYDLYCGTGTISSFIAGSVGKVVGIESVRPAVEDAWENVHRNKIENVSFFAGEAEKIMTQEFTTQHGKPDVIITDPPRAGMHDKVVKAILDAEPDKIIYVSCNPATQARDLGMMKDKYDLVKCQPVDMFPHTQHVENIALLKLDIKPDASADR